MNDRALMYSTEATPRAQFEQAMGYIEDIQGLRKAVPETAAELIAEAVQSDMISVIFGRNTMERAGLGLDETKRIRNAIFRG